VAFWEADAGSVEIVMADFLKLDLPEFLSKRGGGRWIVAGNLPYYITSPVIAKLIEAKDSISAMVLMVQREVAQRLAAPPGSDDYGALSVFVQYHCDIRSVMRVSKNVFYPIPDVDSEALKLTVLEKPRVDARDEGLFFKITRAAFGKRRKTLLNALSSSDDLGWDKDQARAALESAGIDPERRGETLSLEEFARICNAAKGGTDQ
jgi:16S rRNA (adenine1518-N6/adenine1519-N6)-dimethyltransferase